MKDPIFYIDRQTKEIKEELVYGASVLELLYGSSLVARTFGKILSFLVGHFSWFSKFYGFLQKRPSSSKKILPFIEKYHIDTQEFQNTPEEFTSFNDFFCRKLKRNARPIQKNIDSAVMPADGRYFFFKNISDNLRFSVKNQAFNLASFLQNKSLAERYAEGSMLIARLCPVDYHRFHFPCDCIPGYPRLINGTLYSVNPMALKKMSSIFYQNKRMITELSTTHFGKVQYVEVGATSVGTIQQTFLPGKFYTKGEEKGYFSFGGSALVLLFEPNTITFDEDLFQNTQLEIFCKMGQQLGKKIEPS